jgi:hypothetical protein
MVTNYPVIRAYSFALPIQIYQGLVKSHKVTKFDRTACEAVSASFGDLKYVPSNCIVLVKCLVQGRNCDLKATSRLFLLFSSYC